MSSMPMYQVIKESILNRIKSGQYMPGFCLPSEHDFCIEYSVSRMTLRKALDELCYECVLYRIQGKGTFVAKEKVAKSLSQLTSFSMDMHSRGLIPSSALIKMEVRAATQPTADLFQINTGTPLMHIQRLRYANGEPMAMEYAYYREFTASFLTSEEVASRSIYDIFAENGILLYRAVQKIEAVSPSKTDSKYLQINSSIPCLLVMRQTFDSANKVVEVVESIFRGDTYSFYTEVFSV